LNKGFYLVIVFILTLSQAWAQQPRQNVPASAPALSTERPATTHVSLSLDAGKLHLCFWEGAVYSPGSLVNFLDATKNTNICFHCNADGTWDKPCQ
jgi:hypothetical protein